MRLRFLAGPLLVVGAVVWLAHGAAMLDFPFQYDYGEGGTMIASLRLARGESIYPDIQAPPFVVNPYTPVYLWAGSLFMGGGPTLFGGRLVSLGAAGLAAALLFAWLRRRAGLDAAVGGTALFLVHPLVVGWSPLYRTDLLALLFGAAGLVAAEGALRREPSISREILAVLPLSLAFYTKQSMIAPLAASLAAFWWSSPRRAVRFTALAAAALAVPAALLETASGGRFLTMAFGYNVMPFSAWQARLFLGSYLLTAVGLLALAALLGRLEGPGRDRIWWLYLAASVPIAVGSGREGGFYNYCLELHLALCALAGLAWKAAEDRGGAWPRIAGGLILAQLVLGGSTSLPPYLFSPLDHLRYETPAVLRGEVPSWVQDSLGPAQGGRWLQEHPGPILAENLANPTVLGRTPWVVDPLILFTLARSGRWDPEPLLTRVDRKEFSLIFLQRLEGNARFPPYSLERILRSYEVAGQAGADFVLVPRP